VEIRVSAKNTDLPIFCMQINLILFFSNDRTEEELQRLEEKFEKRKFDIIIPEIKTVELMFPV
jgi:hypothetical protein